MSAILYKDKIYGAGGGGGGSTVTITPTLSSGTKIADFEIDGDSGELYAPQGGGGSGSILSGTTAPSNAIGSDGDIYYQYKEGAGSDWTADSGYLVSDANTVFDVLSTDGGTVRHFTKTNSGKAIAVNYVSNSWSGGMLVSQDPLACYYSCEGGTVNTVQSTVIDGVTWYASTAGAWITGANYNTNGVAPDIVCDYSTQPPNNASIIIPLILSTANERTTAVADSIVAVFFKQDGIWLKDETGGGTGQSVFVGTVAPSSSIGNDNDIYVKRSDYSPQLSYKYFKLTITKNRSNSNYTNLGQIVLRKDDNTELIWANYNATVTTNHAGVNANESIDKIIDNTLSTFYTTAYNPTSESPIVIVITTAVEVDLSEFTKYAWYTANELSLRDMVSWTFSVSSDGVDWEVVDTVNDYDVTTNRSTLAYSNAINAQGSGSANPLTIDKTYIKIDGEWVEVEQSSGGTSVIANPEGEATDTLTKVSIDDVIYEISGGGGGGGSGSAYSETDVWTGSADMYTSQSLTLDDDYTNYDALRFEYNAVRGDAQSVPLHYEKVVSAQTLGTSERFIISDFYLWNNVGVCVSGTFTTLTALTTYLEAKNWFRSCTLTKIVGIKY